MILYLVKNERKEKKLTAAWFGKNAQLKRMKFKETKLAIWYKGRSETTTEGFPDGSVVKNLPANAGDMDSIPGLGQSHMPQAQLSPFATTIEPVLESLGTSTTEPTDPRACVPQNERSQQWEAHTLQLESSSHSLQLEKSPHSNENPAQPKIN